MKIKKITLLTGVFVLIMNVLMGANAFAEPPAEPNLMFDENAYTKQLDSKMDQLDKLYIKSIDKKQPKAALKARQEYIKVARVLLQSLNVKFDKMHPERGAALSHTEVLMINHIQVMLLDMLASIHQDEWALDTRIE